MCSTSVRSARFASPAHGETNETEAEQRERAGFGHLGRIEGQVTPLAHNCTAAAVLSLSGRGGEVVQEETKAVVSPGIGPGPIAGSCKFRTNEADSRHTKGLHALGLTDPPRHVKQSGMASGSLHEPLAARISTMLQPIVIDTLRAMHERQRTLHAYCWRCDRWAEIDLAAMIAAGHGERRPPFYARCFECGERGQLLIQVPQPNWSTIYSGQGGQESDGTWHLCLLVIG